VTAVPVPGLPAVLSRAAGRREGVPASIRVLKRVRWAVRATLLLGVAASVAANILHAQPHLVSQLIAAWPPVALLLTVELISRIPVHRMALAATRLLATTVIAGIAAWVSYWLMAAVAARYGETGVSPYLLPISVDGLVVVASISLVELSGRLHTAQSQPSTLQVPTPQPAAQPSTADQPVATPSADPTGAAAPPAPAHEASVDDPPSAAAAGSGTDGESEPAAGQVPSVQDETGGSDPSSHDGGPHPDEQPHPDGGADDDGPPPRPPRGATRTAVIQTYLQDPTLHPTAIAEAVGTSERSVRRYLDAFRSGAGADSSNGSNGARNSHNGSGHDSSSP
jgi:hypothetical protein